MFVTQLQDLEGNLDTQFLDTVRSLYGVILKTKLNKQDIDQEVKQSSIIAVAQIIKVSHKNFSADEISSIINIFGDRLSNELTRESTLKALTLLAAKDGDIIQLQGLNMLSSKLVDLLHKAQRSIHLNTLEAIYSLV